MSILGHACYTVEVRREGKSCLVNLLAITEKSSCQFGINLTQTQFSGDLAADWFCSGVRREHDGASM